MLRKEWTTKQRLFRNLMFVCLIFLLVWILAGMPAITVKGAFRRAMQENLTPGVKPESVLKGDYGYAVLGEYDGVWYQTAVTRKWWIFWDHSEAIGETKPQGGLYIVPLFLQDHILQRKKILMGNWNIPDAAVLADGSFAKLSVEVNGSWTNCDYLGKQGEWFLFSYPILGLSDYTTFANFYSPYLDRLDPRAMLRDPLHGKFLFESYDANSIVVQQGVREF